MYPNEANIDRSQMLDLLADVHLCQTPDQPWAQFEWRRDAHAAAAVLSIGGAVGVYVRMEPDELRLPTMAHEFEIGWIRSNPPKGRLTIREEHLPDPETGKDDPLTHLIGIYRGEPFSGEEIMLSSQRHGWRVDAGQVGVPVEWTRRVYGDPPPAEVLENLNRRHVEQYSTWLWGPAHELARKTRCRHEYGMFDSCPGCDHDEEMGLGPWAGMQTTNTEG